MKVKTNFFDSEGNISDLTLIELRVLYEITSNSIKVSKGLLNRCNIVKDKLIQLLDVIADSKVKVLKDIKEEPWYYERLGGIFSRFFNKGEYKGMSSIRLTDGSNLTKGDRLIFKEFEPDKDDKGIDLCVLVLETLFHYLKPISDFKRSLKPMDFELLTIVESYLIAKNRKDIIIELIKLSKSNQDKIWFFPDE